MRHVGISDKPLASIYLIVNTKCNTENIVNDLLFDFIVKTDKIYFDSVLNIIVQKIDSNRKDICDYETYKKIYHINSNSEIFGYMDLNKNGICDYGTYQITYHKDSNSEILGYLYNFEMLDVLNNLIVNQSDNEKTKLELSAIKRRLTLPIKGVHKKKE